MLAELDITTFLGQQNTWFDLDAATRAVLMYTSRAHGNTYHEQPGEADLAEAKRLALALRAHFGDAVAVTIETIDEWVNLNVYLNPTTPPPAPWGGWVAP